MSKDEPVIKIAVLFLFPKNKWAGEQESSRTAGHGL